MNDKFIAGTIKRIIELNVFWSFDEEYGYKLDEDSLREQFDNKLAELETDFSEMNYERELEELNDKYADMEGWYNSFVEQTEANDNLEFEKDHKNEDVSKETSIIMELRKDLAKLNDKHKEGYTLIQWPESQEYHDIDEYPDCIVANEDKGNGPGGTFVPNKYLCKE